MFRSDVNSQGLVKFSGLVPAKVGRFGYLLETHPKKVFFLSPNHLEIIDGVEISRNFSGEEDGWKISLAHSVFTADFVGLECTVRQAGKPVCQRVVWMSVKPDSKPASHIPHQLPKAYRSWNRARRADLFCGDGIFVANTLTGNDDIGYLSEDFLGIYCGDIKAPATATAFVVISKAHMYRRDGFTVFTRVPVVHMKPNGEFLVSAIVRPASKIKKHIAKKVESGELFTVGEWKRNRRTKKVAKIFNDLLERYGLNL